MSEITITISEKLARGIIKDWNKIPNKYVPLTHFFGDVRRSTVFSSKYPHLKKLIDMLTDIVGEQ